MIGITGSTGFVGSRLLERLYSSNHSLKTIGRHSTAYRVEHIPFDLNEPELLNPLSLKGMVCIVHCAARVHIVRETAESPISEYIKLNTISTLKLATKAAEAGVRRFIYLSSVKSLGESTFEKGGFCSSSSYAPEDDIGLSKARAEEGLREIAARTGMEVTIIRPPLVYGRGVKANFAAMMRLAGRNLPLPLASVRNKRSMVALDNLVDLIVTCVSHKDAGNQTFMVSDDADVSTPELLSAMTRAYGKKPRLLPCPPSLLSLGAGALGKRAVAERVLGSLQVDIEHTKQVLGWTPRVKLEDVLKEMARDSVV